MLGWVGRAMAKGLYCYVLLLLVFTSVVLTDAAGKDGKKRGTPLEAFLTKVQSAALQQVQGNETFDPKYYVDLPLKYSLPSSNGAFLNLTRTNNGRVDKGAFNEFINKYFDKPGSDLLQYNLTDFKKEPQGFLTKVTNTAARKFALDIHAIWYQLARTVKPEVVKEPLQHTLLPLPHPVVVPGARFREVYYWDTYWIVRGLLVSKLYDTATLVVENLIYLVKTYGFVPNGARSYYLNRSQPPLLSEAVKAVYTETKNTSLLELAFPALIKEHKFWSSDRHRVHIRDANGKTHVLTRYNANWDSPRPESFTTDKQTVEGLDAHQKAEVYHQIATTAESGWDFSSRWMGNRQNLTTLKTAYILPVDLNAYLFQMENNIAYFAKLLGKKDIQVHYEKLVKARRVAMDTILWNEGKGQYLDYWLVPRDSTKRPSEKHTFEFDSHNQNTDAFPSNFFPLWCGVVSPGDKKVGKLISSFKSSGLLLPAGVSTSLLQTGQQWDYPNAWANLQDIIIEGFASTNTEEGLALAEDIARRWLRSNYVFYLKNEDMLEKYDARYCGRTGSGGEYQIQAGFGWSNGVVLSLFDKFGWAEDTNLTCLS